MNRVTLFHWRISYAVFNQFFRRNQPKPAHLFKNNLQLQSLFKNCVNYKVPSVYLSLSLLGASKVKMSAETTDLQDLLQNADQLFDENQYQEAVDILKKHPVNIKETVVKEQMNGSNAEQNRDSQYLRSNFITEDALRILRRGLNVDIVESAFEKFMNTALKEALQTIPKDQFNMTSAALQEFKQSFGGFGIDNGIKNDRWLVMPRQFARSATRFSLPINTQKLSTLTPFEYLSQYVWCSDHRKHLYRFVFNKYVCDTLDDQDGIENDCENELERDTPSHATNEKSIQAYVFKESVMPLKQLNDAFTNVLGYCGPIEQMSEKINKIIELTKINKIEDTVINFRSWCGLVAFAERYLNDMPFKEDERDEVEIADFDTLERKFRYATPSTALKEILCIIKYNKKD